MEPKFYFHKNMGRAESGAKICKLLGPRDCTSKLLPTLSHDCRSTKIKATHVTWLQSPFSLFFCQNISSLLRCWYNCSPMLHHLMYSYHHNRSKQNKSAGWSKSHSTEATFKYTITVLWRRNSLVKVCSPIKYGEVRPIQISFQLQKASSILFTVLLKSEHSKQIWKRKRLADLFLRDSREAKFLHPDSFSFMGSWKHKVLNL
jgi:hypothetical protein